MSVPCVLAEDEHLLVINKPAGLNTHAPDRYAGEGIYDWLRHRAPRWASLAIIHRLDKETSGVLVFAKTPLANRSLTEQFTRRSVRKQYWLATDRPIPQEAITIRSHIKRAGDQYVSGDSGEPAETRFCPVRGDPKRGAVGMQPPHVGCYHLVRAEPFTGRTHQIRVHAAARGFPVLGDTLYGGTPAPRVFLHAFELALNHPATGKRVCFTAPPEFNADVRLALRVALLEPELTRAYRLIHGASDAWPGWYVDRFGDFLLSQAEGECSAEQREALARLAERFGAHGVYHKILARRVRQATPDAASPRLVLGSGAPSRFVIRENGLLFELSFDEGYSTGLFLDQRDNRRRLLTGHVAAGFELPPAASILNTFAYTCGFSAAAAKAGSGTTSLDLSKKHLEWGKRNFLLNGQDPAEHDFIYGDVFDWFRRLAKRGRRFDLILLDPPTFSQSRSSGVFAAEKDYGKLVGAALPLLNRPGVLFASSNAASWPPADFMGVLSSSIRSARRKILQQHYAPQPPDFPVSRGEPAYLKTVWLRLD